MGACIGCVAERPSSRLEGDEDPLRAGVRPVNHESRFGERTQIKEGSRGRTEAGNRTEIVRFRMEDGEREDRENDSAREPFRTMRITLGVLQPADSGVKVPPEGPQLCVCAPGSEFFCVDDL